MPHPRSQAMTASAKPPPYSMIFSEYPMIFGEDVSSATMAKAIIMKNPGERIRVTVAVLALVLFLGWSQ